MFGMAVSFTHIDPESSAVVAQVIHHLGGPLYHPPTAQTSDDPSASQPMKLSPRTAVALLGEVARHLAQHGVLTQQEFAAMLAKIKS
jgi:hypothetical protein